MFLDVIRRYEKKEEEEQVDGTIHCFNFNSYKNIPFIQRTTIMTKNSLQIKKILMPIFHVWKLNFTFLSLHFKKKLLEKPKIKVD